MTAKRPDLRLVWLFGSGADAGAHEQMAGSDADVLIQDLEDSTPPDLRGKARALSATTFPAWRAAGKLVCVRINTLDTLGLADLAAVMPHRPDVIAYPKADGAAAIHALHAALAQEEKRHGLGVGSTEILPVCETALGVVSVREMAAASPRVKAALLGSEDLTTDLCAERSQEGTEIDYARRRFLLECRAAAIAGTVEHRARHRESGKHVVAVDAHARHAVGGGALGNRHAALSLHRHRDRPLVVLHEEDHRGGEGSGEHHRLVDVTGAGGSVAEAGQDGVVGAVALDTHGVADGVEGMRADDDGEDTQADAVRIPAGVRVAAVELQQLICLDSAHMEDAGLTVGGEAVVAGAHGVARADLHALLAECGTPQAEFAGALECGGFDVHASGDRDIAIHRAQLVWRDLERVVRVVHALALGREQLHRRLGHGGPFRHRPCGPAPILALPIRP